MHCSFSCCFLYWLPLQGWRRRSCSVLSAFWRAGAERAVQALQRVGTLSRGPRLPTLQRSKSAGRRRGWYSSWRDKRVHLAPHPTRIPNRATQLPLIVPSLPMCSLFCHPATLHDPTEREAFEDPAVLMAKMQKDGFALRQNVLGRRNDASAANQVRHLHYWFPSCGLVATARGHVCKCICTHIRTFSCDTHVARCFIA